MRYALAPMKRHTLLPRAKVALLLHALYGAANALCSIFISVYLWINSHDLALVYRFYLVLFIVTPVFFILAGWYSQARDRLHVYRVGLLLHALLYGLFLVLRERSPEYAIWIGALQGITWGCYWAGANTLNYDLSAVGKREYFFGLMQTISGIVNLASPVAGGLIIRWASTPLQGYQWLFGIVVALFVVSFLLSFLIPPDTERRPFRIRRALFPGRDQRDWQLIMLTSASMSGTFVIFGFLLSLLMYMQNDDELAVGAYASVQALAAVAVSMYAGRRVTQRNRRAFMFWGVATLVAAGCLMAFPLSVYSLVLFGLLRSVSQPLFGIPHSGLYLDIISASVQTPDQRIEYLCAWEVPLAIGRVLMLLAMLGFQSWLEWSEIGVRVSLFGMCAIRIVSYQLVIRTSPMRGTSTTAGS